MAAQKWFHKDGEKNQGEMEIAIRGLGYIEKGNESLVCPVIRKYREKLQYMKENNIKSIPIEEIGITTLEQLEINELIDAAKVKLRPKH